MNIRWITTILLIVTFLAVQDVGYGEDNQSCQPDVVVMFGNGVLNNKQKARMNTQLLMERLETHIIGTDLEGKISYDTSHNPSAGYPLFFLDIFETNVQDAETSFSKFWRYLAGLDLMPDILQDRLKEISSWVDSTVVSLNPSVQEHIARYNTYLREGNVVVLVPHSQGNLYGNIAYLGLDSQYRDGFGIVSVANPDSYVAGGGPYTTIDEDQIIACLQTALVSNLDNFFGPVNLKDLSGHNFIKSYMASGHNAETVILNNVVNMISNLSPTVSGDTAAIFVAGPASGKIGEYDSAAVSVFLDLAKTNWIAWNNTPQVQLSRPSRPGEYFFGPGEYGTNDYITLTVVAPDGDLQTTEIDRNDEMGVAYGIQNVIFGCAKNAPDVFRQNPSFAMPRNAERFLDEGGSHNAIFSGAGVYLFNFSFRDEKFGGGGGNHGNIYLLINGRQ